MMGKGKIDIEIVIQDFAKVLPEHEMVRTEISYIKGSELKLTGVKNFKGEPLQDDFLYQLDVPVLAATRLEDGKPVLKIIDHKHRLRVAWLKYGLQGMYNYLEPYIGAKQLAMVKQKFMKAA